MDSSSSDEEKKPKKVRKVKGKDKKSKSGDIMISSDKFDQMMQMIK